MHRAGKYIVFFFCLLGISWLLRNQPYWGHLLFMIFLYGALAGAWNISGGYGGQISLGHSIFFGIGVYTPSIFFLHLGISPWIGMIFGATLSVMIGLMIGGILIWRLRSHFFALATLAVAEIVFLVTIYWKNLTGGSDGLQLPVVGGPYNFIFESKFPYIFIALLLTLVVTFVSDLIRSNRLGFQLVSAREDEIAAESLGVGTFKVRLIAYAISAFFVSLGGTIYVQYAMFADPSASFGFSVSINMALFTIVGGIATIEGPLLGAAALVPLEMLFRSWFGGKFTGFDILFNGLILIVVVLYFSGGFMEWIRQAKRISGRVQKWMEDESEGKSSPSFLLKETTSLVRNFKLLEVSNLNKTFDGLRAVQDVSFEVKKGEIVGLIGPNGAGKSTFLNMISGVLRSDSGTVRFKKELITSLPAHIICSMGIGRTFQIVQVFQKMTVEENLVVAGFSRLKDINEIKDQAHDVLKFLKLEHLKEEYASNISGGQQKLLELGRALMLNSELYLLDEPFVGVHPKIRMQISELIEGVHSMGKTFIIISHDMKSIFKLSQRLIVFSSGNKIADGDPEKIRHDERVLEAYLGE